MKRVNRNETGTSSKKGLDEIEELLKEVVEGAMGIFTDITKMFSGPMSLDEVVNHYQKATDEIIIQSEDDGLRFAGGSFFFIDNSPQFLGVRSDFYFHDNLDQWVKKSAVSRINPNCFTEDSMMIIKNEGVIEYEIEHPDIDIIDVTPNE